jgi:methionyl-tRNA formyltransferase
MNKKVNFIFWGTPDVARETLEILKKYGYIPSLIITSPDAKSGRGLILQPSPVAMFAEQNNIPCIKPEKLDKEFISKLSAFEFNLSIVVAYGKIIPENIINLPKLGSINIHYSLLPKYRGASPVESAILNGEIETGVSIQQMKYKMDAGDVFAQEILQILPNEKAKELRERLIVAGGELLVKILPDLSENKLEHTKQNESEATYCTKIKKEDGLLDLEDDAEKNYNKFRAYSTWPRTFFFNNGKRIIIADANLENNIFVIKKVIPEGKKEIDWKEFLKSNTSK